MAYFFASIFVEALEKYVDAGARKTALAPARRRYVRRLISLDDSAKRDRFLAALAPLVSDPWVVAAIARSARHVRERS